MTSGFSQITSAPRRNARPTVGIVEVIGRTDADVMNPFLFGQAAELLQVAVKAFNFGEEPDLEGILIQDADRILGIHSGEEMVAGIADSPEVTRSDVTAGADESKILPDFRFP